MIGFQARGTLACCPADHAISNDELAAFLHVFWMFKNMNPDKSVRLSLALEQAFSAIARETSKLWGLPQVWADNHHLANYLPCVLLKLSVAVISRFPFGSLNISTYLVWSRERACWRDGQVDCRFMRQMVSLCKMNYRAWTSKQERHSRLYEQQIYFHCT